MAKVIYIAQSGARHEVDVPPGHTLTEGARDANVPGMKADCGGAYACATCHVYVDGAWVNRIPPAEPLAQDMRDFSRDPWPGPSRLAFKIVTTQEMDGLMLERQG